MHRTNARAGSVRWLNKRDVLILSVRLTSIIVMHNMYSVSKRNSQIIYFCRYITVGLQTFANVRISESSELLVCCNVKDCP